MCSSVVQQLIVDVVNQKVTNGELFTAYDISKCVQAEEKKQGLPFTRHLEIKGDVHRAIAPHLVENGGGYARTLVPIANPQPWLYHPINADPANYIPYGATQPIGSTVNVLTPPAAPSLGGNGKTKMLPGGVMQPPPADDGATALGKAITAPVAAPPLPASDDDDDFQNRSPDARGTLCVPSQLLHEAGIYPGDKTVVVTVERLEKHPAFQKYIRRRSKFKAHDEKNEGRVGDKVLIQECRPLSRNKSWRVVSILERQE